MIFMRLILYYITFWITIYLDLTSPHKKENLFKAILVTQKAQNGCGSDE